MIRIKDAMRKLEPYGAKRQATINRYCLTNQIPCERREYFWYLDEEYIEKAIQWKEQTFLLEDLVDGLVIPAEMMDDDRVRCRRNIRKKAKAYLEVDGYALFFAGNLVKRENESTIVRIITEEIDAYQCMKDRVLITQASKDINVSVYILKMMIKEGRIKSARRVKNNWTIDKTELFEICDTHEMVGIYDFCREIIDGENVLFDLDNGSHRGLLLLYLRSSSLTGYFQSREQMGVHGDRKNAIYFPSYISNEMEKLIVSYVKRFGDTNKRYEMLENSEYWKRYPVTKKALDGFKENKVLPGIVALMETIQATLQVEIVDASDEDVSKMIAYSLAAPVKIYSVYLSKFLNYVKSRFPDCKFNVSLYYDQNSTKSRSIQSDPYPFHQYILGAYMVFNDEFISEHALIQKAIENPVFAWLWLDMCWHYIGAWRYSDICRIKTLPLLHSKSKVKDLIINNEYKNEAEHICLLLEGQINGSNTKPQKTENQQSTEYLVITIPESLRSVIGTVYSICCLHSDNEYVLSTKKEAKDYIAFFGDSYLKVFGHTPFMNRRANKSFLNALVEITEKDSETPNKLMGYLVASFARSHSFSQGKLSETTYKYLQTKLDGYSVDQILMMLWDTGPCSFVPYMLLETIYGDRFTTLKVEDQTTIIKMAKLPPIAAETISENIQNIYLKSQSVLSFIFHNYQETTSKKLIASQMLSNIIQRKAVGKELGIICLCSARGVPCPYRKKKECMGCDYAIYERGFLFLAIERVRSMYLRLDASQTEADRMKYQKLIDEIYLPAVYEILYFCKTTYAMDVEPYKQEIINMISGGREYVMFGIKDGERNDYIDSGN